MDNLDFLKVLYMLAWSDKKLHKEEIKYLDQLQKYFKIKDCNDIDQWKINPLSLDDLKDIDFNNWSIDQKKYVLLIAIIIAEIDGIYTADEHEFITQLESVLEVENVNKELLFQELKHYNKIYGMS